MLPTDRLRAELGAALAGSEPGLARADRLCHACVELLGVDGAAISVTSGDSTLGTFGSSSELSRRLDEFQFTFGEGPCLEAAAQSQPVLISDFRAPDDSSRWPAYAGAVLDLGVRAVYALPVTVGAAPVGALDLFRSDPGPLSEGALAGGLLAARLATLPLLDLMHADIDWTAAAGGDSWAELASLERVEVDQATGMVMAALGVGAAEALARLRAYAFATSMTASEVAWQIVQRRLMLERDDPLPEGRVRP